MEMTEVDIASSLKNLKAKDRIKTSHVFLIFLFFLVTGFTAEFLYIKTLQRELDLLKIEIQNLRGTVNDTNSANLNTNAQVRDLKKETSSKLTNNMETLMFLKNETQKKVDEIDRKTSSVVANMSLLNDDVEKRIQRITEKYDNLFNASVYLIEVSKIPEVLDSLKNKVKHMTQKINSTDYTILSLVKNTSDTNANLKTVIDKNRISLKMQIHNLAEALNNLNESTKAEMKAMKKETSSRWINVTERVESLEHRIHKNEITANYINQVLVDWKTVEYLELVNLTEGLELLKAEKLPHKTDARNISNTKVNVNPQPIQESAEKTRFNVSESSNTSVLQEVTKSKTFDRNNELELSKTAEGNVIYYEKVNATDKENITNVDDANKTTRRLPKSPEISNLPMHVLENSPASVDDANKTTRQMPKIPEISNLPMHVSENSSTSINPVLNEIKSNLTNKVKEKSTLQDLTLNVANMKKATLRLRG